MKTVVNRSFVLSSFALACVSSAAYAGDELVDLTNLSAPKNEFYIGDHVMHDLPSNGKLRAYKICGSDMDEPLIVEWRDSNAAGATWQRAEVPAGQCTHVNAIQARLGSINEPQPGEVLDVKLQRGSR